MTIRIMFLYRVANLPVHLRTHCTPLVPFQVSESAHMFVLALSSPSPTPSCSLSFPRRVPGQGQGSGGYACRWHKAEASLQSSPIMCVQNGLLKVLRQRDVLRASLLSTDSLIRSQATLSFLQVRTESLTASEWRCSLCPTKSQLKLVWTYIYYMHRCGLASKYTAVLFYKLNNPPVEVFKDGKICFDQCTMLQVLEFTNWLRIKTWETPQTNRWMQTIWWLA